MATLELVRKGGTWPNVDPGIIRQIPLPPAGERTRWAGIKHSDLMDALEKAIKDSGLTYGDETWTLSGKGERLFGYIDVSLSRESFDDAKEALDLLEDTEYEDFAFDDVELRMGLRHSNDSTVALYLMVIPKVKEFGNGITVEGGNISLYRRHTTSVTEKEDSLQNIINDGVKRFLQKAAQLQQEISYMREIPVTDSAAHHVMVTAAAKKVIAWGNIKRVEKFWKGGTSAWDLYLAFCRTGMSLTMAREMGLVSQSRKLILELCEECEEIVETMAEEMEETVQEALETVEDVKEEAPEAECDGAFVDPEDMF